MRKPLTFPLIFAGVLLAQGLGQQAFAADLLQVYKDALVNDAQYASARASYSAAQEKTVQAKAAVLPDIDLGGENKRTHFSSNGKSGNSNTYSYGLTLTQSVFNPARWETVEQSKLLVAINQAQFAQAQQELIIRVAQAYFDVLTAQDALEAVKAQKNATSEQLASAKRNFEVGTQTITDTHEAQARYDLIVSQELALQNDLEIKRTALQQIVGKDPGNLAALRSGVNISAPQPANMEDWVQSAQKQNYSVIGAELGLQSATRDIKKNRSGHLPTVDFVATSGRSNASGPSATSNSVALRWNIPLFSGFSVDSKVKESIALEEKARQDLEVAKRAAAQGTRQAFLGVNSGLSQVKALEAAEVSSKSALESNKLGYQVGVRINIDVLNAQQQLYSTRKDLSRARYETLLNGLRLKSAAGILKEDDLVQINALLQN